MKKLLIFVTKNYTIEINNNIIYLITFPLKHKKIKTGINNEKKVAIIAFIDKGPVIIFFPNKK